MPPRPGELGFAGVRVGMKPEVDADLFGFPGAGYLRAVGGTRHDRPSFGASIVVDTGFDRPEAFPGFRAFWLERPSARVDRVTLHAWLDGPSVAAAYNFVTRPGDTAVSEVDAHRYPRRSLKRIGIAPPESMYQFGENKCRVSDDFRPETHDAAGLSIRTGSGELIWRPLVSTPAVRVNSFLDESRQGSGLLQCDRSLDHPQDDGAKDPLRPALRVEPLGAWGRGAVQLVEIPGADETFDTSVAFWNPTDPFVPGREYRFRDRLHCGSEPPGRPDAARVVGTRTGAGGIPGQKHRVMSRKFVIDFAGGRLPGLPRSTRVEPLVVSSRGQLRDTGARRALDRRALALPHRPGQQRPRGLRAALLFA